MTIDEKQLSPEREQTDESLRVERDRADAALGDEPTDVDATADAVIEQARTRADDVLAAARAATDRQTGRANAQSSAVVAEKRSLEDQAVRNERADADETLRAERDEQVALLSIERDETDKDLSDERARSDDALATRDAFLGVVSHDLRGMLSSVVAYASLIARDVSRADHVEKVQAHAVRIQRSATRMNRLIGDLVDVASIEAGMLAVAREVGDPTQVVTEAVDTFQAEASARGVSLVAEVVPPPAVAAHDPARILQVLTNLLGNAIKFTQADGKVVVRVETIRDEVRISVSDTGPGIPADQLEAVFSRFRQVTQNDRRGVGLGLYISKSIVQGHGGRIWVECPTGGGSTFLFTLPVYVGEAAPPSSSLRSRSS